MSFINAEGEQVPVECEYDVLKPEMNDEYSTLRILETLENS